MNRITVGSPIYCKDGRQAGEVDRVVLDPESGRVTHIVARASHFLSRDVALPIAVVETWDASSVCLKVDVLGLEQLREFAEADYVSPPMDDMRGMGYKHGEVVVPIISGAASHGGELREGQEVLCRDGICGTVGEVRVDPMTRQVVSFRLKRAGALTRDVVVPVEWVLALRDKRVEIDCNVRQLEELLPPAEETERTAGA